MRLLVAIMTLDLTTQVALAQTGINGSSPSGAARGSQLGGPSTLTHADELPPLRLLPRDPESVATSPSASATSPGAAPLTKSSAHRESGADKHHRLVAACMQTWDSGTHMTKQEWGRACTRIQTRLDNLSRDGVTPRKK
jgi:hypothetical protein